jgi:hypothetical protein
LINFLSAVIGEGIVRLSSVIYHAGVFAILVHALTDQAKLFYLSCGFIESPIQPMTLMMTTSEAFW